MVSCKPPFFTQKQWDQVKSTGHISVRGGKHDKGGTRTIKFGCSVVDGRTGKKLKKEVTSVGITTVRRDDPRLKAGEKAFRAKAKAAGASSSDTKKTLGLESTDELLKLGGQSIATEKKRLEATRKSILAGGGVSTPVLVGAGIGGVILLVVLLRR